MIKITFDYDGCLSQPKIQELAKKCISLGFQVYILTSRFDCVRRLKFNDLKPNDDIYQTAEEVGVKPSRIAFTNQEKKLKRYKNFKLYAIKYKLTLNNNNNCKNI